MNQDLKFEPFPKIPRLSRPVVVTEKIDGTNASLTIIPEEQARSSILSYDGLIVLNNNGRFSDVHDAWLIAASRKRWIKPGDDNFGFANWAWEHVDELMHGLGKGTH